MKALEEVILIQPVHIPDETLLAAQQTIWNLIILKHQEEAQRTEEELQQPRQRAEHPAQEMTMKKATKHQLAEEAVAAEMAAADHHATVEMAETEITRLKFARRTRPTLW